MKKFLRGIWFVVEFIIIVYVIVLTCFLLCRNKYGYTQFGDYTFTNIDLFAEKNIDNTKKGDLLVVKNSNDINEGDLIYYYAVYNDDYIIKSSPVMSIKNDDYSYLYTVDDSGPTSIVGTRVLGKYSHIYHNLGSILNFLESRIGFLFCVLLPILIIFIYHVYEFIMIVRYEKVELNNISSADGDGDSKLKQEEKHQKEESLEEKKENQKKEEDIEIL